MDQLDLERQPVPLAQVPCSPRLAARSSLADLLVLEHQSRRFALAVLVHQLGLADRLRLANQSHQLVPDRLLIPAVLELPSHQSARQHQSLQSAPLALEALVAQAVQQSRPCQ